MAGFLTLWGLALLARQPPSAVSRGLPLSTAPSGGKLLNSRNFHHTAWGLLPVEPAEFPMTKTYIATPAISSSKGSGCWSTPPTRSSAGWPAEIAVMLMGKHRPTYTPHVDTGDFVVVVNAEKVKFTGKKWEQKSTAGTRLPGPEVGHGGQRAWSVNRS